MFFASIDALSLFEGSFRLAIGLTKSVKTFVNPFVSSKSMREASPKEASLSPPLSERAGRISSSAVVSRKFVPFVEK